jgi:hypothetical protein
VNLHQSDCPKTVPERPAVSEFFGAATVENMESIEENIGVPTLRGAPNAWHGDEHLEEKQVPATRLRDAPRPEESGNKHG